MRRRSGFTLFEMMMATLLTVVVFAVSVPFFRAQTRAVDTSAGRLDALQSARYAIQMLERDLRYAGGISGQPTIVQAAPLALTFNANVFTLTSADPDAAFVDNTVDSLSTIGFRLSAARALPLVSVTYPTQNYIDANRDTTRAETISYYLVRDATAAASDIYTLFRRVNNRDSTVVTRNLQIPSDTAFFFRYRRLTAANALAIIPNDSLPLYWNSANGRADSIRVVELRAQGYYYDTRTASAVTRTINAQIDLTNGGRLSTATCGAAPAAPASVTAAALTFTSGGPRGGRVTFTASTDDNAGARDVRHYVILRRLSAGTTWTTLGTMSATGIATYYFDDYDNITGTYVYGVRSVDCTPRPSTTTTSGSITY